MFLYLNENAELLDTTSCAASYHQTDYRGEGSLPAKSYRFTTLDHVEKYWYV